MSSHFSNHEIGQFGEKQCVKYLKKHYKCRILKRNMRIGHLENDIIAYNRDYILFVEVKTQHTDSNNMHKPSDSVDSRKRANLLNFAYSYIRCLPEKFSRKQPRIDVCEVYVEGLQKLKVCGLNYIESAVGENK